MVRAGRICYCPQALGVLLILWAPASADEKAPTPAQPPVGLLGAVQTERATAEARPPGTDVFVSGANAEVAQPVSGDAFAAGAKVRTRALVEGDAVLAGGEISIENEIDDDLYAAGGSVVIRSTVNENARLAGGSVAITASGAVLGRVTIAAERVEITGRIGESAEVFADRVRLEGEVGGDLHVVARELRIGPAAQVDGRMLFEGASPPEISPTAVIAGGVEYVPRDAPYQLFGTAARAAAWVAATLLVISLVLIGVVLLIAAPVFSAQVASTVGSDPLRSLALGFALVVSIPVAAAAAMASIVGIPLGILLFLCYPILLVLGYLTASLFVGDRIARLMSRSQQRPGIGLRVLGLTTAVVTLALLAIIPTAGIFLLLAAGIFGLGACALRTWRAYRSIVRRPPPSPTAPQGESA